MAILLLVVATVAILTLDFRTGLFRGISGAAEQIVAVFQTGVRTVARPVESLLTGIANNARLRREVAELREENEELRRQSETFGDLARENARLRQLNQLEGTLDVATVRARVIGLSLSGLERSALIDKGRGAGIVADSAVLVPEGLVGRISWVGPRSGKVLLLTDSQSSIGVKIGDTGETGIVTGTGGPLLRLELVSRQALDQGSVKRGDVVLTSGYQGGIFAPGIPVGRVEDVTLAERGTGYLIRVRPFAQLSRLDVMSVALPAEASGSDGGSEPADDEEEVGR